MITLSFPWLVALVVLLFLATLVLLACFKSPMRKWVCFGLSFISIVYLLYIMVWQLQNSEQRLEWYLLACVGIFAAMALAGVGFMDLVKLKPETEAVPSSDIAPVLSAEEVNQTANIDEEENEENSVDIDNEEAEDISDDIDDEETDENSEDIDDEETDDEEADDDDEDSEVEKKKKEEVIQKVMPWLMYQLRQYSDKEQNAIKACAIEFIHEDTISSPFVDIGKNSLYSQLRILEICSAFVLLDKERSDCAEFAMTVFASTFSNTVPSTLERKIKGKGTMQIKIDTYWEAEGINVKNK